MQGRISRGDVITSATKRCNRCGQVKPFGQFYFRDAAHLRYMSRCKACVVDEGLARRGKTRTKPYGGGGNNRNPDNWCRACGCRKFTQRHHGLCHACFVKQDREAACGDGVDNGRWLDAMQKAIALMNKRIGYNQRRTSDWLRTVDNIIASLRSRQRPYGECERKRDCSATATWGRRMSVLAHQRYSRDQWTRAMETKCRNWRRKERKIVVYVKGNVAKITASVARTGLQMRFEWAKVDS